MSAPTCPKHGVAMKPSKSGGFYCTQKDESGPRGYCTHKAQGDAPMQAPPSPTTAPGASEAAPGSRPQTTALARVDLSGMPAWLAEPLKRYAADPSFELMLPSVPINATLGYGYQPAFSVVQISPDPADREVFQVGTRDGRPVFAYSKQGLEKFAEAAGIQVKTTRVDDRRDPDFCEFQALGAMKGSSGQPIIRTASKAFRMPDVEGEAVRNRMRLRNEDEATARKNVAAEMMAFRKHLVARTESGAVLRVFRALLGIKSGLTAEQVARPKVLARVEFNPDPKGNPVVERYLLEKGYAAETALFGPTAPTVGADVRDVTDEGDEDNGADYAAEQGPVQLGNAPLEDAAEPPAEPDYFALINEACRAMGVPAAEKNALFMEHKGDLRAVWNALNARGSR